ncbi:hypothetical protein [Wolbachia endosymbiont of Cantharis cryptica]|uniref:hypothetical protein n=1 Tax=Wolbachia endosymbiont of Cantharis cryptica TaxID=3066132 RepID=UPI00376F0EF3
MTGTLKKSESMCDIIFEAVTKKRETVQKTAKKCKQLFKQGASPEVLTQLEETLKARQDEQTLAKHINPSKQENSPKTSYELKESLKKQREDYKYYIQDFLPALLKEIIYSKKLDEEKALNIVRIILGIIGKSSDKNHLLAELKNEINQPARLNLTKRMKIEKIIMESITSDAVHNSSNYDALVPLVDGLQALTAKNMNTLEPGTNAYGLSNGGGSDSGMSSCELSATSTSSEKSLNSILNPAEEDNDPQKEDTGNQMQPEQTAEEEPQVSSQCVTLGSREKESMDPNSQTTQMTGSQAKDSMQSKEKEEKAVSSKQEASKDILSKKQPNNRGLYKGFTVGCTLLAVGCVVAGAMTSGLGLFAMAVVFAIAAAVTWHLTPSSELTSTNSSPLVDSKQR